MTKREVVLAALAPAQGKQHSPVQVQKLLFLLGREAPQLVDGSHFNFEPYNYGPFDKAVYQVLDQLDEAELVTIRSGGWQRTYALTPTGQNEGDRLLGELSDSAKDYIPRVSAFVLKLNFLQLVSAIYKAYPDMQKNSILRSA
jgi:hypothetical protein